MTPEVKIYQLIIIIGVIHIASWFCAGWRLITDKGMLLYFLRRPIDEAIERIQEDARIQMAGARIKAEDAWRKKWYCDKPLIDIHNEIMVNVEFERKRKLKKFFIFKPFLTCVTCFASFWGTSVIIALVGIPTVKDIPIVFISCVCIAFLSTKRYSEISSS